MNIETKRFFTPLVLAGSLITSSGCDSPTNPSPDDIERPWKELLTEQGRRVEVHMTKVGLRSGWHPLLPLDQLALEQRQLLNLPESGFFFTRQHTDNNGGELQFVIEIKGRPILVTIPEGLATITPDASSPRVNLSWDLSQFIEHTGCFSNNCFRIAKHDSPETYLESLSAITKVELSGRFGE